MAEERETSQTVDKPVPAAPAELDIDSLLPNIPELKGLFDEESPKVSGQPEQQSVPAPETEPGATETALEAQIPEGLKPEGEKPPEPEVPKEETLSESVQKRIDKLTAQRKTAEERVEALQTELTELKSKFQAPPPLMPTAQSPLADITTETELAKKIEHIQEARAWCTRHSDGGEVADGNGGKRWLDGNEVKAIWANADLMLSKHVPERKDFIANKKVFDAEAKRQYPALFKEGSEAQKVLNQWLSIFPECQRYPDITLIVGDALVGQQIRLNRTKARPNGNSPGAAGSPLAPPAPAASPRVPQNRTLSGQALHEAFANDPRGALDSFVNSLIEGGATQRAAKK